MNPAAPTPGTSGGGFMPNIPIWYPPMSLNWIITGLVVFAAAVANRLRPNIRGYFTSPFGFFVTAAAAFGTFKYGFPPLAFAILFFLLSVWAAQESEGFVNRVKERKECDAMYSGQEAYPQFFEGFIGASDVEFVTNGKRWFVERILKEHPEAIIDKGVLTQAISGFSAQGSTNVGNT
jgi:hypothetical protein